MFNKAKGGNKLTKKLENAATIQCCKYGCSLIQSDGTCFAINSPVEVWEEGDCWAKTKEPGAIAKRKQAMKRYSGEGGGKRACRAEQLHRPGRYAACAGEIAGKGEVE